MEFYFKLTQILEIYTYSVSIIREVFYINLKNLAATLCLSGHHCYFKKKIALFLTFCEKFSSMKNDDQGGLKENL